MREFDLASFAAFCAVGAGVEHAIHAGMRAGIHAMSQAIAGEAKRDGSEDERNAYAGRQPAARE